ncbi:protein Lilipod isoform X2 [Neocloeon triangulifer]|uniref:protein Lilipod isoform X2 n=1 Tax=Neocloeon triangulifer TaxID=2078957 RepID=UPI00286F6144|nr:protein Lilipod isoform X2 [Neocloeon triangulifer]
MEDEETTEEEQIFHNTVRENIIFLLLFLALIAVSWSLVRRYRKRERDDILVDDEEATVYRISLWLCTFSLAVAAGAVLLLPISIISNEVLLHYPKSYYVQWLNSSLIQGLWNHIFLFSNLSLFVLLPFAYLFTESEGFAGHRKGILPRIYETFIVLLLLAFVVLGLAFILSSMLDSDKSSLQKLFNLSSYYLPFIYSCVSFLGVLLLLLCTPAGLVQLFSMASQILVKPQFLRDLNEEYFVAKFEEECLKKQLEAHTSKSNGNGALPHSNFSTPKSANSRKRKLSDSDDEDVVDKVSPFASSVFSASLLLANSTILPSSPDDPDAGLRNGALKASLTQRLNAARAKTNLLQKQRHGSTLKRNFLYPIAMLLLLFLTCTTVVIVVQNAVQLVVGLKELPRSTREQVTLGLASLSKLGMFGATLEIVLIVYLVATSAVGLFTTSFMRRVRPVPSATPLSSIILHCALLLLLSSALPLLSRILGITNLDLLGEFGQIEWLGSLLIVLSYNTLFVLSVSACIATKFTATVREELYARLKGFAVSLVSNDVTCPTWPNSPIQATGSANSSSSAKT